MTIVWFVLVVLGAVVFWIAIDIMASRSVSGRPFRRQFFFREARGRTAAKYIGMVERREMSAHDAWSAYQDEVGCMYMRDGGRNMQLINDLYRPEIDRLDGLVHEARARAGL